WFGGSETADAVPDVVFGDYAPCGKLTTSFPRTVGQCPMSYNEYNTGRPQAKWFTKFTTSYLDTPNEPLYPFGFGLSYTNFDYSDLTLDKSEMTETGTITATVTVTNNGNYDGVEVVQLYIRDLVGSVVRPVKELKDFSRISLRKGESSTVSFTINAEKLKFYNSQLQYVCEPGEFQVMVGPNSRDVKTKTFTLK
ncbi:MAG: fibronectin type III-like domain-contianing protein, partial [Bacteroidales bacterium]|nr:fibronectin type III-like domain-contianing protein [Bacteroidales bacterium]